MNSQRAAFVIPIVLQITRQTMRSAILALLVTGTAFSVGCVTAKFAPQIVQAPNQHGAPTFQGDGTSAATLAATYAATFRVNVGPPDAEMPVGVIDPGNYAHRYRLETRHRKDGSPFLNVNTTWNPRRSNAPAGAPRGTIVILHGFWMRRETMTHWALNLAEAGYRTVLVDLRGHGEATGDWITFGARESLDLGQVLDELERRDLVAGPVGVLGASYGAVVALNWAARDDRVRAIVAIEPYSDAAKAIVEYARATLGSKSKGSAATT